MEKVKVELKNGPIINVNVTLLIAKNSNINLSNTKKKKSVLIIVEHPCIETLLDVSKLDDYLLIHINENNTVKWITTLKNPSSGSFRILSIAKRFLLIHESKLISDFRGIKSIEWLSKDELLRMKNYIKYKIRTRIDFLETDEAEVFELYKKNKLIMTVFTRRDLEKYLREGYHILQVPKEIELAQLRESLSNKNR